MSLFLYNPIDPLGADAAGQRRREAEAESSAAEWRQRAERMENGLRKIAAEAYSEINLVTEILDEIDGIKPKRLSVRANKHLRNEFRQLKEAEFKIKNKNRDAVNLDFSSPDAPPTPPAKKD